MRANKMNLIHEIFHKFQEFCQKFILNQFKKMIKEKLNKF